MKKDDKTPEQDETEETGTFKKVLEIAIRCAGAAILIYFLYNIILTQHELFS